MVPQLTPLTEEEAKKFETLMQMSVRNLREEAKREGLCAGAKTKSELAYSMVKEKRPRRKPSNTKDAPPNRSPKCKGPPRRRGSHYSPPPGVANHPQQPFPPKFSPAQLLAGADEEINLLRNQPTSSQQIEDSDDAMTSLDRTRDQIFDEILKLCKDSEKAGLNEPAESLRMVDFLENWRRISPHWSLEEIGTIIREGHTTTHSYSWTNVEVQFLHYFLELLEDELNRSGRTYRGDKEKLKDDAEKLVAYARQLVNNSRERHRDEPAMSHGHDCVLSETTLDLIEPLPGPRRSNDNEAESTHLGQRLHQSSLHDERLADGYPSSAERGHHECVIDNHQAGWTCSTNPEQLPSFDKVYDTATPSPVIYHPSPTFSVQPDLSSIRLATLVPVQCWSPTPGRLSSYPASSFEKHGSEPIDSPRPLRPPTELLEEDRTLPPLREALNFLSWPDHPQAVPPFSHY